MFSDLLALGPLYLSGLALLPIVAWFVFVPLYINTRIRRTGGVRAHVLATNPITGLPWFFLAASKHSQNKLLEFYDGLYDSTPATSKNVVEISVDGKLRYVLTRDPEHIKTILTSKFTDFGKGAVFHQVWSPFLGDSIFTTDGKQWQDSRGLIRPSFIKEKVSDLLIFEKWTQTMMSLMPKSGQTVEMMDLFYRMTLDVTTDFLLGSSVNSLNNPAHEFVGAFSDVQRSQMMQTILYPILWALPVGEYKRGIKTIERFMDPYIKQALSLPPDEIEKLSKSDKKCTFLHQIVRYSRDPKVIRDQIMAYVNNAEKFLPTMSPEYRNTELRCDHARTPSVVYSVLLAGRDTTAATLSWCIYELTHYPAVYAKLRNEVLGTVGESRAPTYADLKNMTYLTHTLNETLRMYPAVPYNLRACLEDSTLPSPPGQPDVGVLKDDVVIYSTFSMQRRKDLYPPVSDKFADPAIFSPERWDHWSPKPWQFVPFNGGPRICVGQNFAMTEMAFVLVRLLQKYDRIEYRGDWYAQLHKAEIVGCPGDGVPVAFHEAQKGDIA